jgi:zinc protease
MLDRTIAPPFQRNHTLDLLNAEITDLPNGIKTYSVLGGQQEVVKIELIVKAGRWFEQNSGAAHFAANLLSKGTSSRSSFDIARIFDLYGAHVEINPGLDVVSVALYTLTKNIEPVLTLLFEIITEASFPQKELDQAKSIFIQNLKVNQEKTSFQASKLFRRNLFGENHPYGKELEENIQELNREQIVQHYKTCFKDVTIVISGRATAAQIDLVTDTFSRLDTLASPNKSYPMKEVQPARILSSKEDSIQSSIRMGKRFIGRRHPDYYKVLLLNHILGGYFGSRLMKNIREEKGLTYGIYSSIHPLIHDTYIAIGADVNKENLELTFDEIRKELKRLGTEKISQDELDTARNHFIGNLQSEITTPFAHADKWKNIILYGLPLNYYPLLSERLGKVTSDELMLTAAEYFTEDSFLEVAVG